MAADKEHSAPADSEERASKEANPEEHVSGVPRWLAVTAVLALAGVVAGGIVYGYLAKPKPEWIGVANKNVWDWLKLLVVPTALAIGVYWLNTRQAARQQREEDRRQASVDAAQEAQAKQALALEDQRAQDAALQAFLDQMSQLLTDREPPLRKSKEGDEVRTLARARTLAALRRLDEERKSVVVRFLMELGLVQQERTDQGQPTLDLPPDAGIVRFLRNFVPRQQEPIKEEHGDKQPIISLSGASLSDTDLSAASLVGAELSGANLRNSDLSTSDLSYANLKTAVLRGAFAELRGTLRSVDMSRADLEDADLRDADFSGANMTRTHLHKADLRNATLVGADLTGAWPARADLSDTNLAAANLTGARLFLANLTNASLHEADLRNASLYKANLSGVRGVTNEELDRQARSLEGATMPNGQKYEDWLKDKEDGKETGEDE